MADQSFLTEYLSILDAPKTLEYVKSKVAQGGDPQTLLAECREGLEEVGKKFEKGEYFIADLMYAGHLFQKIMEVVEPELKKRGMKVEDKGKIIIATVKDDIHDIGKNLVASMFKASGFEMIDLGINVSPDFICTKIEEHHPDIVALSCLLTTTIDSVENTIAAITKAGLREKVKIIVGGNPLSPELAKAMGADAYGNDAYEAVIRCRELLGMSGEE